MRDGIGAILVPCQDWSERRIKAEIFQRIKDFDPIEGISFCSFLNMIAQTQDTETLIKKSNKELLEARVTRRAVKGILFNRYSLLYLMNLFSNLAFSKTEQITGHPSDEYRFPKKFYEALLLANDLYTDEEKKSGNHTSSLLRTTFLREWPYYYMPLIVEELAKNRIIRYQYVFTDLIAKLPQDRASALVQAVSELEILHNISLKNFFKGLEKLFFWFMRVPNANQRIPSGPLQKFGFKPDDISSFYIQKAQFDEDENFLKCLQSLAVTGWASAINDIQNISFYDGIKPIFDNPIFQGATDVYCIADLGFVIDKIGGGFLWRLMPKDQAKRDKCLRQRGYLLEGYFNELVRRIFPEAVITGDQINQPDAVVETDGYILIFEFTTERIDTATLYSSDITKLEASIQKCLFETGSGKPGKFKKLNDYVESYLLRGKTIIPILITESRFGDFDLLDPIGGWLTKAIKQNALKNLEKFKPIIMDLDDLEAYWGMSQADSSSTNFSEALLEWNALGNKGPFHFTLMNYLQGQFAQRSTNINWSSFFRPPQPIPTE